VSAISATAIMVVIDAPNIKSVTSIVVRVSSMGVRRFELLTNAPSGRQISNFTRPG
jgi:hypothetical protein